MGTISDFQEFVEDVGVEENVDHMYAITAAVGNGADAIMEARFNDADEEAFAEIHEAIVFNLISSVTQYASANGIDVEGAIMNGHEEVSQEEQKEELTEEMLEALMLSEDESSLDEVFANMTQTEEGEIDADNVDVEISD